MRRLDTGIIHHAETIAAYGGAWGAVKEEDVFLKTRGFSLWSYLQQRAEALDVFHDDAAGVHL